jgi:hypothetical protein
MKGSVSSMGPTPSTEQSILLLYYIIPLYYTILYYYYNILGNYCSFKMYVTVEQNILHMTHLAYKKFYLFCKNYCENSVYESDCNCLHEYI